VMAISVILISSGSSEDSVGTPNGRVILFGTIPTTIPDTTPMITLPTTSTDTTVIPIETPIIAPTVPPSPDYSPASPDYSLDYSPASETESNPSEDPSSDHIPPLPATSPFLSSVNDTTDSDTLDTPPSPTHGTPFTEITASTQRSPADTYDDCEKEGWTVSCSQLAVGHPVDHPSSNYFSLDDSARDSSSDSSSKESSDFHSNASSDSSSGHSLSYHSSPDLSSTSAGPSRKTRRSPMMSVPALPLVSGALSPVRADLAKIDECIAYVDALRDRGIDARVVVEAVDQDETEMGVRGPVEVRVERVTHPAMPDHIPEPAQEGAIEREKGHRIVGVKSVVTALIERVTELERDTRRLRGTASVKSQRVDRLQRDMSRMQRELRQIR
ncbi:hypothetical protein Tco_0034114, partial [Tanacetum coccineum]